MIAQSEQSGDTEGTMQHAIFPVVRTPYCVWEWDLGARNAGFIRTVDEQYFEYLAIVHSQFLEDEEAKGRAALALRAAYHHGLETFLTLLSATIQAPHCLPGLIQKAKIGDVVHPLNQCEFRDGGDAEAPGLTMGAPAAPDERMPVVVPIGGGPPYRLFDLGPRLEPSTLQRQRTQRLPPGPKAVGHRRALCQARRLKG